MNDSEKSAFAAALTELAALKQSTRLTTEMYNAWWNAMREKWTLAEFCEACSHLRDTMEFMPNPFHFAQLRKQATEKTAGEAWALVREAARTGGSCPDVPAIRNAVAALGGIRAIGLTNTDQMQFLERRFAEHYEAMRDAAEIREELPRIASQGRNLTGPQSVAGMLTHLTPTKDIH